MRIQVPELSLVVLIGPSGSGKSSFARRHFRSTEVLSSDYCRGLVSDDENDQSATPDAFEVLHFLASKRLSRGRLTVVDATNVQPESRKPLVQLARAHHCLPIAIVLDLPESICQQRNQNRADRNFGPHVVRQQRSQMRRSLRELRREGFRDVFVLSSEDLVDGATVERVPLWCNKKSEHGPFDFIGDVHGCCDELESLLLQLGYTIQPTPGSGGSVLLAPTVFAHPAGRKAVFVGDLVDRGPRVVDTLRLVATMVAHGSALCLPGNHDMKLLRKLSGSDVKIAHGLAETLSEIDALDGGIKDAFCRELCQFLDAMVSHYVLDDGRIVVAHAGLKEEFHGRGSAAVRAFALFGETTGETDEFGLPVRCNWAADYRGNAHVVYGHTPVPDAEWLNRTINIDTGCVFGGRLTALRFPEREIVSVPAKQTYCEPSRPFLRVHSPGLTAQHQLDDVLDLDDVSGKRIISTHLSRNITIREENGIAALEVMSRFAVNPKWLVYLPPTMSPCETSNEPGLLEHPAEGFAYFREEGVKQVVCQKKHMGSRGVIVVCRDPESASKRFGVTSGVLGMIYTRTGRRFFQDWQLETELLKQIRDTLTEVGFWEEFNTDWVCLDCEIMPWSAKAQELLRTQYAAVGAVGEWSLHRAIDSIDQAIERLGGRDGAAVLASMRDRFAYRAKTVRDYVDAYRHYCWRIDTIANYKIAPFHVLATEGCVYTDRDHRWHMETIARVCQHHTQLLVATPYRLVDTDDATSVAQGIQWWETLTAAGGEGMVIKPMEWIVRNKNGIVQPAVKCRGKEYLRIIYGPDYDAPENLSRLRNRGLGRKRSLAIREFALGLEGLERFVRAEPLRKVHECVFGVLALESEPVDPRL
ncbi:MAG: polynucleotide kinase-phosphatase [Planctomycetes bacterium]|nr:polynucleotide kinase-phosphatase [Planctomycetota bacterium]